MALEGKREIFTATSWRLVNEERSIDVAFKVPGCVLDTLQDAGLIKDPLYRCCWCWRDRD